MTFHCLTSYFKHESRLPIGQPFDPDKTLLYVAHIYKLLQSNVVVTKIILFPTNFPEKKTERSLIPSFLCAVIKFSID